MIISGLIIIVEFEVIMFKRILVANRGEIALRIIRCAREMDIETVIVYSTADKESLPVMGANYSVCIGPNSPKDSYLNQDAIIETAIKMECDAIHPGYGFLSENAEFAKKCEENNITFIGPSSELISKMGDKQEARKLMMNNGVRVVPGSREIIKDVDEALEIAEEIGYPVLIKASAGGGGRGMRKVFEKEELPKLFEMAKAEAKAAFANDDMYIEKLIINPRHIEVQILADKHENVIALGERDCSIQKNNQKMLEESPACGLSDEKRKEISDMAILAGKVSGYNSVGTCEFVLDKDDNFYFIEMNTRIQVEHPVTEEVSNVDLIRQQIRVAAGLKLDITNEDVSICGHAIEFRIIAKTPGVIKNLHLPGGFGVRVETHLYNGYEITPFYDPMIAKVIVKGKNRLEVIRRLRRVLEEIVIDGIETNIVFLHQLTFHPDFLKGNYDTGFYEKESKKILSWINESKNMKKEA